MLFLYELKKLYKNRIFITLLIVFSFINIFCIYDLCSSFFTDNTYQTEVNLTDKFEGKLTKEKVNFINENYKKLSLLIETNSYNTEYDSSSFTGYQMMDYNIFSNLNDELSYIYNYSKTAEKTIKSLDSAGEFYKNNNNEKEYNKAQKIKSSIKNRKISELHNYKGINEYINYNTSSLFILILCIFISVFTFSSDTEITEIIYTSSKSKKNIFKNKILSLVLNVFLITFLFCAINLITFNILLGTRGIFSPLYALKDYAFTLFNFNIFSFSLLNILAIAICNMIISLLSSILTIFIKKSNYSMIASISFLALLVGFSSKFSPIDLLNLKNEFLYPIFICNIPSFYFKLLIWTFVSVLLTLILCILQKGIIKNGNIKTRI